MLEFASVWSYERFARSVSREWRYTRDGEQATFLATVLATSEKLREKIPAGRILWRAQKGCNWPEASEQEELNPGPVPFSPSRMKPVADRAPEGRVNPVGIPCLYAATELETAIAEVRPWMGENVSVAQLRTNRELTFVDCSLSDGKYRFYPGGEPNAAERQRACWRDINRAFARPVERSDHAPDYVPTQVIAEMFRRAGLDGIGYGSSLGSGLNIALFGLGDAEVMNCTVHAIANVKLESELASNPYFVAERNPEAVNQGGAGHLHQSRDAAGGAIESFVNCCPGLRQSGWARDRAGARGGVQGGGDRDLVPWLPLSSLDRLVVRRRPLFCHPADGARP
jgi:hypothetical protein